MMPVMIPSPSTESYMKMLEELYASVCEQDQCSSFILGEKRDPVIDIVRNVATIRSSCEPNQLAMLTPKRWANFILYCQQIDNEAKELNLKTRPVAFRLHLSDGWYVSVTGGYNCVEFRRFYVPYGTLHGHVRPTQSSSRRMGRTPGVYTDYSRTSSGTGWDLCWGTIAAAWKAQT